MRYQRFLFMTLLYIGTLTGSCLFADEDLKSIIAQYHQLVQQSDLTHRSESEKNLAIAYYKDQEQEKAFQVFLEALNDAVPVGSTHQVSENELQAYEQALQFYLSQSDSPQENAKRLIADFGSIADAHPDYHLLGYIIAAAEANLDQFPRFFERFYQSYLVFPEHYMAYKAMAVLHIKLFNRGRTPSERELQRQKILESAITASTMYPQDHTLYKIILSFTPRDKQGKALTDLLNKIIDENIMIPRSDIAIYVDQAIEFKQTELAQKLVNKGREWYCYSRIVEEAQQRLTLQEN